jgi:alcohol dehydrogenase
VDHFEIARDLLRDFKGDTYRFGHGVLNDVGGLAASAGKRAVLIRSGFPGTEGYLDIIRRALAQAGVALVAEIRGAAPNTPREDVARIASELQRANPDVIVSFGGGSTIDAAKAAEVLRMLGGGIDDYFGTGLVTKKLSGMGILPMSSTGVPPVDSGLGRPCDGDPGPQSQWIAIGSPPKRDESRLGRGSTGETEPVGNRTPSWAGRPCYGLTPHVAIQTAASSAAHLTKYATITDLKTGQKKLIVDDAIVPAHPVFDYTVTHTAPPALTADGAMDGLSHILEVFYGAAGKPYYDRLAQIAQTGISLIVNYLPQILQKGKPENRGQKTEDSALLRAREALCLATDLGGYAIMLGGTNGGHLTSFSLVDILSHGRACALMNPYYTVFFAPAIEGPLRVVGGIFADAGYLSVGAKNLSSLQGRDLGIAVANGMFAFAKAIGFPTTLSDVKGFTPGHIDRALTAAKNPQLRMKLENMPIPMTAAKIDETMGPILAAAVTGDVSLIQT